MGREMTKVRITNLINGKADLESVSNEDVLDDWYIYMSITEPL
jgi:hypothetical protein